MKNVVSFILGMCAGGALTYFVTKKVIQDKADEEIQSVVETFRNKTNMIEKILTDHQKEQLGIHTPNEEIVKNEENITKEEDMKNYESITEDLGYSNKSEENITTNPYIIDEEEFGEFGNEEITLIYYDDGVLADDGNNVILDVESVVGECLKEFKDDMESLYIRDEVKEIDYVILRSEKRWADIAPDEVIN